MAKKESVWILVPDGEFADQALIASLGEMNKCSEKKEFIDDEGQKRNGQVVEFELLNFFLGTLLSDQRFKITPFIDDGVSAPKKWVFGGGRKKAAENLRKIQ